SQGGCPPPTTAAGITTTKCIFTTTTTVVAGGTFSFSLTNPNGAVFASPGVTGPGAAPLPTGCAVAAGIGQQTLTVACAIASLGIPFGTQLEPTVQLPSASVTSASFVTESVTYNANGAAPQNPQPVTQDGSCGDMPVPAGGSTASGDLALCIVQPLVTVATS